MKEIAVIDTVHQCEFCKRTFARERTLFNHICEKKHRWLDKDKKGNRIGFQSFIQFYTRHTSNGKAKTYLDFIASPYYGAFVKFGTYCSEVNVINPSRFVDWLLKDNIKIDTWNKDTVYTKFLYEYLRVEDPYDAIHRSVQTCMELSETEGIQARDCLRYANPNKICYLISTGKISPWLLYQSDSGIRFLETLSPDRVTIVLDYINPEQWAIKFKRDPEVAKQIKELLSTGGY
jgi:hypothetical protein